MEEDPNPPIPLWIVAVTLSLVGWSLTFGLAWLLHPVFQPSLEMTAYPNDVLGHLSALVSTTFVCLAFFAYMIGIHWGRFWAEWKFFVGIQVFWGAIAWWMYFNGHPASPETVCGLGGAIFPAYANRLSRIKPQEQKA